MSESQRLLREFHETEKKSKEIFRQYLVEQDREHGRNVQELIGKCFREKTHYFLIQSYEEQQYSVFEFDEFQKMWGGQEWSEKKGCYFGYAKMYREEIYGCDEISRDEFLKTFKETLYRFTSLLHEIEVMPR